MFNFLCRWWYTASLFLLVSTLYNVKQSTILFTVDLPLTHSYFFVIISSIAVPFIILSIDDGESPEEVDPNATPGENGQVSQQTGVLLALFAAGILSKCLYCSDLLNGSRKSAMSQMGSSVLIWLSLHSRISNFWISW